MTPLSRLIYHMFLILDLSRTMAEKCDLLVHHSGSQ
jgi:hypothetical protein